MECHCEWISFISGECYGAIDDKHSNIITPSNCGSVFVNYKKCNSIALLIQEDHYYCFHLSLKVNWNAADGAVYNIGSLASALEIRTVIPRGGVIVDDSLLLKLYWMKLYSENNLTFEDKVFNYRWCRFWRCYLSYRKSLFKRLQVGSEYV